MCNGKMEGRGDETRKSVKEQDWDQKLWGGEEAYGLWAMCYGCRYKGICGIGNPVNASVEVADSLFGNPELRSTWSPHAWKHTQIPGLSDKAEWDAAITSSVIGKSSHSI